MFSKKDKLLIAGFITLAAVGLVTSFFFILGPDKKTESKTEEEIAIEQKVKKEEDIKKSIEVDEVTFENEELNELPEEESDAIISQIDYLIEGGKFEEIVDLIAPIVEKNNLTTDKNKRISNVYSDANLMLVQETIENDKERGNFITELNDIKMAVASPLYLPMGAFMYTAYDVNSLNVGSRGDVKLGTETIIDLYKEDDKGSKVVNPELLTDPHISLFLDSWGEYDDLSYFSKFDVTVQGNELTAYVAKKITGSTVLLGYFAKKDATTTFQTNQFYFEQAQKLEKAVNNDWE